MKIFNKQQVTDLLPYPELIDALRDAFRKGGQAPLRHSHSVATDQGTDNSLLLMPCWIEGDMLGIKLVMVCPDNHKKNLESVRSTYILSDANTGENLALMEGDELTARRTACASALASSYLSDPASKKMLMIGTGKIAQHLIYAHAAVRNLSDIYIWGRNEENARHLADTLRKELNIKICSVKNPEKHANICDIISCATMSSEPVLNGKWLNSSKRQHIDLVGAYTPNMREADNDVIKLCDIYVDTYQGALAEAGDLTRPMEEGIIDRKDIVAELSEMVLPDFTVRNMTRSTLFKSVGNALEDLTAAKLVYNKASL